MRKNSRKTTAFLLSVLAISGASVWARGQKSVYKLADIQIYGTQQISDEEVKEKFEPKIRAWFESRSRGTKKDDARAADLRAKLVADVKKFGDFGWVRLTESEVASERNVKMILLMFDVIEKQHMATRFPFRSPPSGSVKDGTGLLEDWNRFYALGWKRVRSGEVPAERGDCPAYFCPEGVGSGNSEIDALKDKIENRVPSNEDHLSQILETDRDPKRRAAALFLLAFLDDGSKVSEYAARAMFDAEPSVREAATSIFSDIAVYHKDVPIPVQRILKLIDSPYPEDRGRALALALSLSDNPDYESYLISTVATDIVKLLRSKNLANHEMAHTVLTLLSGEDFPAKDFDAWENWLWKARKERMEGVKSD